MQTKTQRREYQRKWRNRNLSKYNEYQRLYNEARRKGVPMGFIPEIHPDTGEVLKNLPNPFGTFEKAKYTVCINNSTEPFYFFTTTCRTAEDCIEIMKERFVRRFVRQVKSPRFCSIYKIVGGVSELIFKYNILK